MDRNKILQRIANLRARAENDASSEAEAMAAASRAAALMEQHNVMEADLVISEGKETVFEIVRESMDGGNGKQRHRSQMCLFLINQLTDTRTVIFNNTEVVFIGHRSDVEFAVYLYTVIKTAMDREFTRWKSQNGSTYGDKSSFQCGMANRINDRLREMHRDITDTREANADVDRGANVSPSRSTALVVLDMAAKKVKQRDEAYEAMFPKVKKGRSKFRATKASAYIAGQKAGSRVGLGRGIACH